MINIPKFHFLPVIGRSFGKIAKDLSLSLPPFLVFSKEATRRRRPVRREFRKPVFVFL